MGLWEMGVVVPIKNHLMRRGSEASCRFNGSYDPSVDGTTLTVDGGTPEAHNKIFAAGDKIVLGPSSATGHVNRRETVEVSSTTSTTIVITDAASYNYDDNDYITGTGSLLAGGWDLYCATSGAEPDPSRVAVSSSETWGEFSEYAQRITYVSGAGTDSETCFQDTDLDTVLNSTKYRLTFWYKVGGSSPTCSIAWAIYDDDGSAVSGGDFSGGQYETSLSSTSWTKFQVAKTTPSSGCSYFRIDFRLKNGCTVGDWLQYTGVFIEHASGTDDATNGYYTVDSYPDLGSVRVNEYETSKFIRLGDATGKVYDTTGLGGLQKKHIVMAEFSNVDTTFYENLLKLKYWQKEGYLLSLHHDIDGIPPVLVGTISLTGFRKSMWNISKSSFVFSFQEV